MLKMSRKLELKHVHSLSSRVHLSSFPESQVNLYIPEEDENDETVTEDETVTYTDPVEWESIRSFPDSDIVNRVTTWGAHGIVHMDEAMWDDTKKPFKKYKSKNKKPTELEETGFLSDRIIANCSTYLDRNPETGQFALCKCDLNNKSLSDISILRYHRFLQYLDLSCNSLEDLTPLGELRYLMYLDVSHNRLKDVLRFNPPCYLSFVNYSHNFVSHIDDLSEFWSLLELNLSHNNIQEISGLEKLRYLRNLNLSFNDIMEVKNLNHMKLMDLDLSNNKIYTFEGGPNMGFKTLTHISFIHLGHNRLQTLKIFEDLSEIKYLKESRVLVDLNLTGNRITEWPNYMEYCLDSVPSLGFLDGVNIQMTTKVAANVLFSPNTKLSHIRMHAHQFLREKLNHPTIGLHVVPIDRPPFPILLLVGPEGSKRGELVRLLAEKYPNKIKIGVCHITRPPVQGEVEGKEYYFISREMFNIMIRKGSFICFTNFLGHSSGFAYSELSKVANERVVLVTQTDMSGALAFRSKGLQPRLILAISSTEDLYEQWLKAKFKTSYYNYAIPEGALNIFTDPSYQFTVPPSSAECVAQDILGNVLECVSNINEYKHSILQKRPVAKPPSYTDVLSSSSSTDCRIDKSKTDLAETPHSILKPRPSGGTEIMTPRQSVSFKERSPSRSESSTDLNTGRSLSSKNVKFDATEETSKSTALSISETAVQCDVGLLSKLSEVQIGLHEPSEVSLSSVGSYFTDSSKMVLGQIRATKYEHFGSEEQTEYIKLSLKSREQLLNLHITEPGLFYTSVYTDEPQQAVRKLENILRKMLQEYPVNHPKHSYNEDSETYRSIMGNRLGALCEQLSRDMDFNEPSDDLQTDSYLESAKLLRAKREDFQSFFKTK